jgi:hypothetical protein
MTMAMAKTTMGEAKMITCMAKMAIDDAKMVTGG